MDSNTISAIQPYLLTISILLGVILVVVPIIASVVGKNVKDLGASVNSLGKTMVNVETDIKWALKTMADDKEQQRAYVAARHDFEMETTKAIATIKSELSDLRRHGSN